MLFSGERDSPLDMTPESLSEVRFIETLRELLATGGSVFLYLDDGQRTEISFHRPPRLRIVTEDAT